MSRITQHVLAELIKTFLITSVVMTTFLVMIFLVQEALRENLTPETILQLVPYTIPTALCFSLPGTILFAACIVYGRMSANNEIVAIKAMGVSPVKVVWPGLAFALLLSFVTVYLNDLSVSWGKHGVYRVVLNSAAKTIYSVLKTQGNFRKDKMVISVEGIKDDILINPVIEMASSEPSKAFRIEAQMAKLSVDRLKNKLVFKIRNGFVDRGSAFESVIDELNYPIELGTVTKKTNTAKSPSNIPLRNISVESANQAKVIERKKEELALNATMQLLGGNMTALTHPQWNDDLGSLEKEVYRSHRLKTEPWRRWANGFSCFCFVLVGAGVAITFRKFDFWSIFGVCFIPILLVYYPLLMYGVGEAKSGDLPPYSVWMGNMVMFVVGLWLMRRIERR